MLIAYYIITKSFGGIRLVSDVILCNTWCRCYCTNWYLMLVAQMLCAIPYGTVVIVHYVWHRCYYAYFV